MVNRRTGIAALALLAVWGWGRSDARSSRPEVEAVQEWTLPCESADGLRLQTHGGNIQVTGGSGDQLQVRAVKRVRAADEAQARAFLQEMKVDRRREGGQWVVEAKWPEPRPRRIESAGVSFEVRVPRGMRLDAQTGVGNLEVSGVGESRLRTGGGNVSLRDAGGKAEVHTGGGNVEVVRCEGPIELETGGGNIEIRAAKRSVKAHTGGGNVSIDGQAGPVEAHTGRGNIGIERAVSPVRATTGGGNVSVSVARADGGAEVELGTGAGELSLSLPEGISARLEAQTGQGRVHLESSTGARFNREQTRAEATLGDGRGSVRLHTGSGSIHVRLGSR